MPATSIYHVPLSFTASCQEPKTAADSPSAPPGTPGAIPPGADTAGGTGTTAGGGATAPSSSCIDPSMLLPLGLFMALMYFMVLRPENKRRKETQAMLATVAVGDKIVTTGGLHGVVNRLDDRTVTLVVDSIKMTFDRAAIGRVDRGEAAAQAAGKPAGK